MQEGQLPAVSLCCPKRVLTVVAYCCCRDAFEGLLFSLELVISIVSLIFRNYLHVLPHGLELIVIQHAN